MPDIRNFFAPKEKKASRAIERDGNGCDVHQSRGAGHGGQGRWLREGGDGGQEGRPAVRPRLLATTCADTPALKKPGGGSFEGTLFTEGNDNISARVSRFLDLRQTVPATATCRKARRRFRLHIARLEWETAIGCELSKALRLYIAGSHVRHFRVRLRRKPSADVVNRWLERGWRMVPM